MTDDVAALKHRLQPELPDSPEFGIDHWYVGWNSRLLPNTDKCAPYPDSTGWSQKFVSTAGSNYRRWGTLSHERKLQEIVNGFLFLVLGQGIDPVAVHREFWKIGEYRNLEMSFFGSGECIIFQGKGRCDPYNE